MHINKYRVNLNEMAYKCKYLWICKITNIVWICMSTVGCLKNLHKFANICEFASSCKFLHILIESFSHGHTLGISLSLLILSNPSMSLQILTNLGRSLQILTNPNKSSQILTNPFYESVQIFWSLSKSLQSMQTLVQLVPLSRCIAFKSMHSRRAQH